MRDEYNINELNPRKNPYVNRLKKQITINIDGGTIDYFKSLADAKGFKISPEGIFREPFQLFQCLQGSITHDI